MDEKSLISNENFSYADEKIEGYVKGNDTEDKIENLITGSEAFDISCDFLEKEVAKFLSVTSSGKMLASISEHVKKQASIGGKYIEITFPQVISTQAFDVWEHIFSTRGYGVTDILKNSNGMVFSFRINW